VANGRLEARAVTAALRSRALRRRNRSDISSGGGFDATPGVLVAVCGLHGGAGTTATTTALAVATAVRSRRGGALAVEAAAVGELAERLGTASPWSLPRLAALVADGSMPDGTAFAERPDGLRVLAATQPDPQCVGPGIAAVLGEARRAHALVVCDAGPAGSAPAFQCLPLADAVLWIARSDRLGATIGRLSGGLARPARRAPWGLVIRGGRPSRRALAAVRDDVRARIVLPDEPGDPEAGAALLALVRRLLG
jgi:hypothetical protein